MPALVESLFYTGEVPWHGEGTPLDGPATAEEAIVAAGMDWEVWLEPKFTHTRNGEQIPSKCRSVVRYIDGKPRVLGDVGGRYTPLQNRGAFGFFDAVVGEGQAIYHTAGVIGQGEMVWILAKLPESFDVVKNDTMEEYLLLVNGHSGEVQIWILETPIRVVCYNTLTSAVSGAGSMFKIKHYKGVRDKVQQAQEFLGLTQKYYADFKEISRSMSARDITPQGLDDYLKDLFPGDSTVTSNKRNGIKGRFESDRNRIKGMEGTVWAAYNSVTEYVDWEGSTKRAKDGSQRLKSIWLGGGADKKREAWERAAELVTA